MINVYYQSQREDVTKLNSYSLHSIMEAYDFVMSNFMQHFIASDIDVLHTRLIKISEDKSPGPIIKVTYQVQKYDSILSTLVFVEKKYYIVYEF